MPDQDGLHGRLPPHDLDAEAVVLSDLLMAPEHIAEQRLLLRGNTFYSEANREIYLATLAVADADVAVDLVSVAAFLRQRGKLATIGGAAYLGTICDATPSVANVADHVRIIAELEQRRRVINVAHRIAAEGYEDRHGGSGEWATESVERLRVAAGGIEKRTAAVAVLLGAELAEPLPPLEYLLAELAMVAGPGAPHLVAGYGYSGKTLALQAMLLSMAAGLQVWGTYACTMRRVAHVDLEQGQRLTARRYQRLAAAMGLDLSGLDDRLAVAVMPGLALTPDESERWRALMAGRDVIVVDSLRAATPGADENSSDIRAGLDMLGGLSEDTGCRAVVIHHARKPAAGESGSTDRYGIRGSSAIYDGCDSVLVFGAQKGEPVGVEVVKARSHGELPDSICLVIEDVELDGERRAGLAVNMRGAELLTERRESAAQGRKAAAAQRDAEVVRAALSRTPSGLGSRELRDATGLSGQRLPAALAALGTDVCQRKGQRGKVLHALGWCGP